MNESEVERQGAVLGKVIYWAIVLFFAGLAVFGTYTAAYKKGLTGVPTLVVAGGTLALWALVGVMAYRGLRSKS